MVIKMGRFKCPECGSDKDFQIEYGYEFTSVYKNGKRVETTRVCLEPMVSCRVCNEHEPLENSKYKNNLESMKIIFKRKKKGDSERK